MKLLQEVDVEPNNIQRRISQLVHVHHMREEVFKNTQLYQDKMKKVFEKRTKVDDSQINDSVLKWDARNEDKGKHAKFENLWKGPYKVVKYHGKYIFVTRD
jgi:IS5 family transposase